MQLREDWALVLEGPKKQDRNGDHAFALRSFFHEDPFYIRKLRLKLAKNHNVLRTSLSPPGGGGEGDAFTEFLGESSGENEQMLASSRHRSSCPTAICV